MVKQKILLAFECCAEYDDKIWFSAFDHNGLYYFNKNDKQKKAVFAGKIPGEETYAFRLYSSICTVNRKVVLIPFFAREIAVYNIENGTFTKISLKPAAEFSMSVSAMDSRRFWCSATSGKYVYMFPHNYPAVVKLDTDTLKIDYSTKAEKIIEKRRVNGECYFSDIYIQNDEAFLSVGCSNSIMKMSMISDNYHTIDIPYDGKGFNGIYKCGHKIWLAPRIDGAIISYDTENGKVNEYNNYPKGFEAPAVPFHKIYKYNEDLLFVADLANQFVILDPTTGVMRNLEAASCQLNKTKSGLFSFDRVMYNDVKDNVLSFISGIDYKLYTIADDCVKCSEEISIISEYPCNERLTDGAFNTSEEKTICETQTLGITALINYIDCVSDVYSNKEKMKIGESIHECIKT